MTISTNVAPYFNDFDESKNFQQILFKPGIAVQARELTQLQSIISNQISRFGSHIFKAGSIVAGGGLQLNTVAHRYSVDSTNLVSEYFSDFIADWFLVDGFGNEAKIMFASDAASGNPSYIYIKSISGDLFANSTNIAIYDETNYGYLHDGNAGTTAVPVASTNTTSVSAQYTLAHTDPGVTYVDGHFVYYGKQIIVLGTTPVTAVVGFDVNQYFTTSYEDLSLLDPAQGSSNYAAPGADRLVIDLTLATRLWDGKSDLQPTSTDFIELARVRAGYIQDLRRQPVYSDIMDTMARRTYDESGNYIVSNFSASADAGVPSDSEFTLTVSPGKAYVRGYEIEKIAPREVFVRKARDFESVSGADVICSYGNYTLVTFADIDDSANLGTLFSPTSPTQVKLHNTEVPIDDTTQVGTAFVKAVEHSKTGVIYKLYLFDIKMTSGSFGSVRSFITGTGAAQTCRMIVDASAISGSLALLFDTAFDASIFPFPQPQIQSVSSLDFYTRRYFGNKTTSGNQFTISTNDGTERFAGGSSSAVSGSDVNLLYTVYNKTTGNVVDMTVAGRSIFINPVTLGNLATALITLDASIGGHNFDVIATIDVEGSSYRSKTLTLSAPQTKTSALASTVYSLGRVDVYNVEVFETAGLVTTGHTYTTVGDVTSISAAAHGLTTGNSVYVEFGSHVVASGMYSVTVVDANTFTVVTIDVDSGSGSFSNGNKITSTFTFDNGQRDTYYDYATITSGGSAPPDFTVFMSYFNHSSTERALYTLASYTNTPYDKIPSYTTKRSNTIIQLRDSLDFRFDRTDAQAFGSVYAALVSSSFNGSNNQLPSTQFFSIINSGYSYYKSRIDKIVLMSTGDFRVVEGVSSFFDPKPPVDLVNGLTLFEIHQNAFTGTGNDITVKKLNHRVYTMKDIAELDRRITAIEYYTQLSLLENETANKNLFTSTGSSVFKNGFLVDSFISNQVADTSPNSEMKSVINIAKKIAQPLVAIGKIEYIWNVSSTASNYTTNVAMIPHNAEEYLINQPLASTTINVNPYAVIRTLGNLTLTPSSDVWMDVVEDPTFNIVEGSTFTSRVNTEVITGWGGDVFLGSDTSTALTETNRFIANSTFSVIPWVRSRIVEFTVDGMKPNTNLYTIFDGKDISDKVTPAVLKTDNHGKVSGSFVIPNEPTRRFSTGSNAVILASVNEASLFQHDTSVAMAAYNTSGTLRVDDTRITLRRDTFVVNRWRQVNAPPPAGGGGGKDPVAQTFFVDENLFRAGVFITSLTLYFAKKDANVPVTVQLRPTANGYPDSNVVHHGSVVTKEPADVNVSETDLVPTVFTFPAPVHLPPGEHSFVIMTLSDKYEIYIAQQGGTNRATGRRITSQPYTGSMFISQNSSTWTADQWSDVTFELKKAKFPVGSPYTVILDNVEEEDLFEFGRANVPTMDIQFGGNSVGSTPLTSTTYELRTKDKGAGTFSSQQITSATDVFFDSVKEMPAAEANGTRITMTLVTNDQDVSPIVDLEKALTILGDWTINDDATNELLPGGGNAAAKYITKPVTLAEELDAKHIYATMGVNRVLGTSIKMYYKVLHASDSTAFSQRPWVEMTKKAKLYDVSAVGEFIEDEYYAENISYVSDSATLSGFKTYAIKIVMLSNNKVNAPTLANIRVTVGS